MNDSCLGPKLFWRFCLSDLELKQFQRLIVILFPFCRPLVLQLLQQPELCKEPGNPLGDPRKWQESRYLSSHLLPLKVYFRRKLELEAGSQSESGHSNGRQSCSSNQMAFVRLNRSWKLPQDRLYIKSSLEGWGSHYSLVSRELHSK